MTNAGTWSRGSASPFAFACLTRLGAVRSSCGQSTSALDRSRNEARLCFGGTKTRAALWRQIASRSGAARGTLTGEKSMSENSDGASGARRTKTISIPSRQGTASHLVVLLHGVGANAESFQELARVLARGLPGAEFLVPDGFHPFDSGGSGRQWFSFRGVTEKNRPARVREAGTEASRWIDGELASRGLGGDRLAVVGSPGARSSRHGSPRRSAARGARPSAGSGRGGCPWPGGR